MTLRDGGCDFDSNPPEQREPGKSGRPPTKIAEAIEFLQNKLAHEDRKGCELIDEWEGRGQAKGTIINAKKALLDQGRLVVDDSQKPQMWHLVANDEDQYLSEGADLSLDDL